MTHTTTPQTKSPETYTGKNMYVILHRNHPRMREYTINRDFKLQLLGIAHVIGITNAPSDELLNTIGGMLQEKYNDFTFEEIKNAFMLYSTGEIGDEAGTEYGDKVIKKENSTFNAPFVCSVLNQYRIIRGAQFKRDERQTPASHQLPERNEIDWPQFCKEHFETYIKLIKQEKRYDLEFTNWGALFEHLENIGEIVMTAEEKLEYKTELKNKELETLRDRYDKAFYDDQRALINNEIERFKDEVILKEICRKKICIAYFQQHYKIK